MGRKALDLTPEQRALRQRVLALRRRTRPTHTRGDKYAWVSAFLNLYDAQAWHVMGETRLDFLHAFSLVPQRVTEFRAYMQVHAAAVEAGANPYHLRYVPVRVLTEHRPLIGKPNLLIEALLGKKAAEQRRRKVHNQAARKRLRRSL